MSDSEQRAFKRFPFRMSLEYWPANGDPPQTRWRTTTEDVSPAGVRFETPGSDLRVGSLLNLRLTAPPGPGHFPYDVQLVGLGRVIRVESPSPAADEDAYDPSSPPRQRVAAQFTRPLRVLMPDH